MKKTALRSCSLALGVALIGSFVASTHAETATTDPVGYYTLPIQGASDNVMSLPMVRDAVFAGTVGGGITSTGFNVLAGQVAPAWTAGQFQYRNAAQASPQPQTYYAEFTSGELKGLFYKIDQNGAASLTLDTEGDSLLSHDLPGLPAQALKVGDSFKIRPYWRLKDVFEVAGQPIIEPRPNEFTLRDEILIPNYSTVGINKAPNVTLYYLQGVGWQLVGDEGVDYGNYVLRPNEAFVVRRRNAAAVNLTNLGGVLMNRSITYVPGGTAAAKNDIYVSLNRPADVSLNNSGLRVADQTLSLIKDSANQFTIGDQLLAFGPGTGFNRAPSRTFYFLAGQAAGQGWREFGDDENATVGDTFKLEPGRVYVVRKNQNNPGRDWVNDANY
jgi:uncharacterized protein (TIGR02597 family)